jgi:hypothetical protein
MEYQNYRVNQIEGMESWEDGKEREGLLQIYLCYRITLFLGMVVFS